MTVNDTVKSKKPTGNGSTRKNNKIRDAYHKLSHNITKLYDVICMEDLNIKGMFQDTTQSSKLQRIGLASLVDKIRYKADWYGKILIQISRWFASSKICSNCGYYNKKPKTRKQRMDMSAM